MARPRKQEKEQSPFVLPDNFVPEYTLPKWSTQITKQLVDSSDLKGSPGFEPGPIQAQQIEKLCALGLSLEDIASTLRIEPKLLKKYYKYELETADKRTNAAVAKVALQLALSGASPEMTKFWLKTRAGWKETKEVQMTGAGGGPIVFQEVKQRMLDAIEAEIIDVETE